MAAAALRAMHAFDPETQLSLTATEPGGIAGTTPTVA